MNKKEIAQIFEEIAVLLELQAANPFRIRAYRNGARALLNTDEDLKILVQEKRLADLEGIGEDLAGKITTLYKTGRLPFYEKLKKSTPPGVLELLKVQGLGGKKIKVLAKKLKIRSIDDLKKACLEGKVAKLPRFGEKTQANILESLGHLETYQKRHLWWQAWQVAESMMEELRQLKTVKKIEIGGSLRRKLETIGDLDFLVGSSNPAAVIKWFTTQSFVARVLAKGKTKASIKLINGMQADLRIVPLSQFEFALNYITGSKEHNIKLRDFALGKGWTLSEYGLESVNPRKKGPFEGRRIDSEEEIYKILGFSFIPPELREDRGELEAAKKGKLPKLVEYEDIRGTFHNHTTASDGKNTLKEMIAAADELGWEYIGISDHSQSSVQANGQTEEQVLGQLQEIRKINTSKKYNTYVFAGVECDILPNGKLDFSDKLLSKLDYVVVSVHSALNQDEKTMTKRIIRAIENPYSTMVGHLTGRLLLRREGYSVNIPKIIDACIANGKIIEINSNPQRLDMDWRWWHSASERGLMCCINTDAHSVETLRFYRAGVNVARKGWLEKKHILNTRPLKDVQKYLKK